jgi:ABC-type multidrug transport system ATPase subunit
MRLTPHSAALIRLEGVTMRYGRRKPALTGIDLTIYANETLAITGSNGSGKSTLLRILGGIVPPGDGFRRLSSPLGWCRSCRRRCRCC